MTGAASATEMTRPYTEIPVHSWEREKAGGSRQDRIASEVPVALTYNRVSHVVMMATPAHLEEFGLGFSLTEGLIGGVSDLHDIKVIPRDSGLELAMTISPEWFDRLAVQRRNMAGRTGCGLCGAENLHQAMRKVAPVENRLRVTSQALQRAVCGLEDMQPLQAETGAAHGAAWCDADGQVLRVLEDIGRHNALDKLIGSLCATGFQSAAGFVLISSRASYEMVYKAAAVGIELVAAVSAPTTLALKSAIESGLTLVGFARPGRHNVYTFPERIAEQETPA